MTKLVVTPIDINAPGSYRQRKKFLGLISRLATVKDQKPDDVLAILDETDALIRSHLKTDDDTPVEELLDQLSAKDFDQLLSAIAFEGADTVPSGNSSS